MKPLAKDAPAPALVAALDAALADGGASPLDPSVPAHVWERALVGPAAEFLARPGKELRARVVAIGWELAGGAPGRAPAALATVIELLHAGSLIVDDVEDGSDERRGAPALHTLYGAPLAINTGNWMYFWALAELARAPLPAGAWPEAQRAALRTMLACHQGQALDLSARVTELDAADVPAVVSATTRLKTAALCRFAVELGAIAAGASRARRDAIGRVGEAMGIALQMLDDLGGVTAPARRAKGVEDLRGGRPTWLWAWLAERGDPFAWSRATQLARAVIGGADPAPLVELLAGAVAAAGRAQIRATIDRALAIAGPDAEMLAALLRGMEAQYA